MYNIPLFGKTTNIARIKGAIHNYRTERKELYEKQEKGQS